MADITYIDRDAAVAAAKAAASEETEVEKLRLQLIVCIEQLAVAETALDLAITETQRDSIASALG